MTFADPDMAETVKLGLLQEVALVELQVSVDDWPDAIVVGLAVSATVGDEGGGGAAAVTVTVALALADPPPPLHAIE